MGTVYVNKSVPLLFVPSKPDPGLAALPRSAAGRRDRRRYPATLVSADAAGRRLQTGTMDKASAAAARRGISKKLAFASALLLADALLVAAIINFVPCKVFLLSNFVSFNYFWCKSFVFDGFRFCIWYVRYENWLGCVHVAGTVFFFNTVSTVMFGNFGSFSDENGMAWVKCRLVGSWEEKEIIWIWRETLGLLFIQLGSCMSIQLYST